MIHTRILYCFLLVLFGCSSSPHTEQYIASSWKQLYNTDEVVLKFRKTEPIIEQNNALRNIWGFKIQNKTNRYKCVNIQWNVLNLSNQTIKGWFLLNPQQLKHLGYMVQSGWIENNVFVPIEPIGIIQSFKIKTTLHKMCE